MSYFKWLTDGKYEILSMEHPYHIQVWQVQRRGWAHPFSAVFQFGLHLVANQFVNQSLSPLYVISMHRLDVVMDNSRSSCFQGIYGLFLWNAQKFLLLFPNSPQEFPWSLF